ncbi:MAG: Rrf2 family transcriptional regulator [Planctomycetes bacterium]|nr:Rrf2 family transcriptional regulator [Planctomycetota bacterium]
MVAVSKRSEYALRAVFELAYRGSQEPVKIQRIAESQGIPSRFLEGIMSDLRHAGFVESRRGSEGGYVLVMDSGELCVADVLRAVQGQLSVGPESNDKIANTYCAGDAAFSQYWQKVDNVMMNLFTEMTFADLVKSEQVNTDAVLDFNI